MKEYNLNQSTFVGGWYIPEKICDKLIDFYKKNEHKTQVGTVGQGGQGYQVDKTVKEDTELSIYSEDFDKIDDYLSALKNVLNNYKKKYPYSNEVYHYNIFNGIKIQHYKPGEGYYAWHPENSGKGKVKNRHLVFMTYLNTIENGGTEFYHQNLTTPCEKGLTLIWPSAWTHVHRGVVNKENEKYIITGWFNFDDYDVDNMDVVTYKEDINEE